MRCLDFGCSWIILDGVMVKFRRVFGRNQSRERNMRLEKFDFYIFQLARKRLNPVMLKCFDSATNEIRCTYQNKKKEEIEVGITLIFASRAYEHNRSKTWENLICLYCMHCTRYHSCCCFSIRIRYFHTDTMDYFMKYSVDNRAKRE